jgi:hypothetical protein
MSKCFVIMPFSGKIGSYYEKIYSKSIRDCGMTPLRADEYFGARPIMSDVIKSIYESDIILADLTDRNPNVNYELGIAHSLGKPTIMIAQSKGDIPFDYQHIRIHFYDTADPDWQSELSNYIAKSIKTIISNPNQFALYDSEILKEKEKTLKVLKSTYNLQQAIFINSYDNFIDSSGKCIMEINSEIDCISNFSLIRWRAFISEPGEILVDEAIEYPTGVNVDFIVIKSDFTSKDIYFILNNKKPGTKFKFKLKAQLDNYLVDLIKNGITTVHHDNAHSQNPNIVYQYDKLVYCFPNTELFNNISGIIKIKYSDDTISSKTMEKSYVKDVILLSFRDNEAEKVRGLQIIFKLSDK